jgi:hypothetical protein
VNALNEPLVTIHFRSASMSLIKKELTTFGLNPSDWNPILTRSEDRSRLILAHRDDEDVRLAVQLHAEGRARSTPAIQNVEWVLT